MIGVLQARAGSSRLPGKVLRPLLGEPMLARQIERLRRCERIDRLVVATSMETSDDAIDALCHKLSINCYRGSLNDVLDRFYQAARDYGATQVVRLTGDCPLADPRIIDDVIVAHLEHGNDYTSNTLQPTYPDGLDVEVFRFTCLDVAWREATLSSQREHVTPFIYQHPERFRLENVRSVEDMSQLRWTVDEPEDFEFVRRVYEALYPVKPDFGTNEILDLLHRQPELATLNAGRQRNEGFACSQAADTAPSSLGTHDK